MKIDFFSLDNICLLDDGAAAAVAHFLVFAAAVRLVVKCSARVRSA